VWVHACKEQTKRKKERCRSVKARGWSRQLCARKIGRVAGLGAESSTSRLRQTQAVAGGAEDLSMGVTPKVKKGDPKSDRKRFHFSSAPSQIRSNFAMQARVGFLAISAQAEPKPLQNLERSIIACEIRGSDRGKNSTSQPITLNATGETGEGRRKPTCCGFRDPRRMRFRTSMLGAKRHRSRTSYEKAVARKIRREFV